jgi:hypothetical protein
MAAILSDVQARQCPTACDGLWAQLIATSFEERIVELRTNNSGLKLGDRPGLTMQFPTFSNFPAISLLPFGQSPVAASSPGSTVSSNQTWSSAAPSMIVLRPVAGGVAQSCSCLQTIYKSPESVPESTILSPSIPDSRPLQLFQSFSKSQSPPK